MFTWASGNEVVTRVSGLVPTLIVNCRVATWAAESLARTVNTKVPEAVDVPEITPPVLKDSPVGKAPAVTDQVIGGTPPLAFKVVL